MKKTALGIISSTAALFGVALPAFAQTPPAPPTTGGGPVFCFPTTDVPFTNLGVLLARALVLLFFFAAILAFVFIVIGGIQWITAGGDKAGAQAARDRITAAVVGLVIVVAAFAITLIVTAALNINIFGGAITLPGGSIFNPSGACPAQ
jgi:hypothetical protein